MGASKPAGIGGTLGRQIKLLFISFIMHFLSKEMF